MFKYPHDRKKLWSCSYGSWIYNYLCNQCLSLKLRVRIPLMAKCTRYNIVWSSLSVTYDKSLVFSLTTGRWYSHLRQVVGILTVLRIPPSIKLTAQYNWNMVESGAKHHSSTRLKYFWKCCLALFLHTTRQCYNSHSLVTFCHASKTCVIGAFITL
jgi:hypothetical protein